MDDLVRVESGIECIKPLVSNLEIDYGLVELGLKLPPKAEQTTEVALQALQIIDKWGHHKYTLQSISKKLYSPEFCLAAVTIYGYNLRFVPENLKTNEMCLIAIRQNGTNLEYSLKTKELCLEAVKNNGLSLQYVPKTKGLPTDEMYLEAIKNNGACIQFVPRRLLTKEVCLEAIKSADNNRIEFFSFLSYVPTKAMTEKLCQIAMNNGDWLCYVPKKFCSDMLYEAAINGNYLNLAYIPEKQLSEKLVLLAISSAQTKIGKYDYFNKEIYKLIICIPEKARTETVISRLINAFGINRLKSVAQLTEELHEGNRYEINVGPTKVFAVSELFNRAELNRIQKIMGSVVQNSPKYPLSCISTLPETELNDNNSLGSACDRQKYILTRIEARTNLKIYYITDIHLEHQLQEIAVNYDNAKENTLEKLENVSDATLDEYLTKKIEEMIAPDYQDLHEFGVTPYLLVGGDVSHSKLLTQRFYLKLAEIWQKTTWGNGVILSVLGNHELWDDHPYTYEPTNRTLTEVIKDYIQQFIELDQGHDKCVLLWNSLYIKYKTSHVTKLLTQKIINNSSVDDLRVLLSKCSLIVLGGTGFSGLNPVLNTSKGIYRSTITSQEQDYELSQQFKCIYDKVMQAASDFQVIVLTHMPMSDWSNDDYNSNWIYISGHTHNNSIIRKEDGTTVLSDNQIGYKPQTWKLNAFTVSGIYDPFCNYPDGIYTISSELYADFYRGRGIASNGCNYPGILYCLKKKGDYLFLLLSEVSLYLMDGGQRKTLIKGKVTKTKRLVPSIEDIKYYYTHMDKYAENIRALTTPYQNELKRIAEEVRAFGGEGKTHGCIVDIDFLNHIYLNPLDGKITPYYALDIRGRYSYSNVENLLKEHAPQLFISYKKAVNAKLLTVLATQSDTALPKDKEAELSKPRKSKWSSGTDIYKASRVLKSYQYLLENNIIRNWDDSFIGFFNEGDENVLLKGKL